MERVTAPFASYVLAVALAVHLTAAGAATSEDGYITAREAFIAKLNPPGDPVAPTEADSKEEERARVELAKQMRVLIGPLNVKGFPGEGRYIVGSLFKGDMESGILDGLQFTGNWDVRLVVTTTDLANRWIKSPDGLAVTDRAVPKDLPTALTLDLFYTRATTGDAAVANMGELPVTKPAGVEFAFAMLAVRRQDIVPAPASEMLIGVIAPPRVYILNAPIANIKMMAPCAKISRDADAKADKMIEDNEKSPNKKENIGDDTEHVREQADETMRKCFAQRVKSDPAFTRLTKQAQEYVDALAGK